MVDNRQVRERTQAVLALLLKRLEAALASGKEMTESMLLTVLRFCSETGLKLDHSLELVPVRIEVPRDICRICGLHETECPGRHDGDEWSDFPPILG